MIEISTQIRPDYSFAPFSQEDLDLAKEYKPNQIVKNKITGVEKPRSLKQLRTYWRCCTTVANNNETPGWQTKKQVDFQCRVELRFYDPELIIALQDGSIAFHYRSIAIKNLKHIEACGYFDDALAIMAKKIETTVEELIKNKD